MPEKRTVQELLEAFRRCFAGEHRVERLVYERGKDSFIVEYSVPETELPSPEADQFLTPFQMIRQHADLDIQHPERRSTAVERVASAVQDITRAGCDLTMFVCAAREEVREWFGATLRVEDVWGVPLLEDPEVMQKGIFVVGSSTGRSLADIERAVFCSMED